MEFEEIESKSSEELKLDVYKLLIKLDCKEKKLKMMERIYYIVIITYSILLVVLVLLNLRF